MKKQLFIFLCLLISWNSTRSFAKQSATSTKSNPTPAKDLHWSVSVATQSGQKMCYVTSSPVSSNSTCSQARSKPFVTVTYISKTLDEVSSSSGLNHKGSVTATIDGKSKKTLSVIDGKVAWTQNIDTDKELIELMKKGTSMIIESNSSECGLIKDRYSLMGFTKAYENMRHMCISESAILN